MPAGGFLVMSRVTPRQSACLGSIPVSGFGGEIVRLKQLRTPLLIGHQHAAFDLRNPEVSAKMCKVKRTD